MPNNINLINKNGSAVTAATSGQKYRKPQYVINKQGNARELLSIENSMVMNKLDDADENKSKLSNQNALLSMLSNEDFSQLKDTILEKIQFNPSEAELNKQTSDVVSNGEDLEAVAR